jgi:hypothetical protein
MRNAMQNDAISTEERKKELIAQGAAFRTQLIDAKNGVHAGLRPDTLSKGAMNHIAMAVIDAFKNGSAARIAGANLSTVLPLVVTGISALSKSSLLKPVMRGVVIAGAAAAVAMLVLKKKKARDGS